MTQPSDILFQLISGLTGGLVTDLTTAMLGMLMLGIIIMGFDHLRDIFEEKLHARNVNSSLDRARTYKKLAESAGDDVSRDYLNARYRSEIRRASR